jgi:hypothetical protein
VQYLYVSGVKSPLGIQSMRRKIILKVILNQRNIKEKDCEGVVRIRVGQDMGQWRAVVNAVMNPGVP